MNCRGCPDGCLVQRLEGWGGSLSYSMWDPHRVADGGSLFHRGPTKILPRKEAFTSWCAQQHRDEH